MLSIGLLGAGVVGSGVKRILEEKFSEQVCIRKILVRSDREKLAENYTTDPYEVLDDEEISVIIEAMGGIHPAYDYVSYALSHHKNVISANKKMLANCYDELMETARSNHTTLRYEAACGGGIPLFHNISRLQRSDTISSVKGILNGTCNYILSEMSTGLSFEEALQNAQKLGYAEADPSDDICGYDTQNKLSLLCADVFHTRLKPEEIPLFGIDRISEVDSEIARGSSRLIKLVASASRTENGIEAFVMPVFVPWEDSFASISGNFNILRLESDYLGRFEMTAQGAGSLPTADAIVQDLMDIHHTADRVFEKGITDLNTNRYRFYINTSNPEVFTDITKHNLITVKVTLQTLIDKIKEANDPDIFVALYEGDYD